LAKYNYGLSPLEQHHQKKKLRKRNCLEEVLFFGDKISHLAIFIFQKMKITHENFVILRDLFSPFSHI